MCDEPAVSRGQLQSRYIFLYRGIETSSARAESPKATSINRVSPCNRTVLLKSNISSNKSRDDCPYDSRWISRSLQGVFLFVPASLLHRCESQDIHRQELCGCQLEVHPRGMHTGGACNEAHGARGAVASRTLKESRRHLALASQNPSRTVRQGCGLERLLMILPQVHLRNPCYDFSFL